MSELSSLRMSDVLRVQRLYGDLFGLPPLSAEWKRCLLEGALRLIPARLATMPEVVELRPGGTPRPRSNFAVGWLDESGQRLLQEYHIRPDAARINPLLPGLSRQSRRFFTLARSDLVDDRTWHRSELVDEYLRPGGVGDNLSSTYRVDRKGWTIGLDFYRAWGDRPFTQRDRNVLHVLNAGLIPIYRENPQVTRRRPLAPRVQQTLDYLLAGDSEKQIARRMDLSQHTVHQYVKTLYRAFGVSSRSELLLACLAPKRRHLAYENGSGRSAMMGRSQRGRKHTRLETPIVTEIRVDRND